MSTVNKVWPGCVYRFRISVAKQNKGEYMDKLVYGVGVNDLGYRTQVEEEVTKNGGKRIRKIVFKCKYYTVWKSMLTRCYSKKIPGELPNLYWNKRV